MKHTFYLLIAAMVTLVACEDNTDTIGMSLSKAMEDYTLQVSADEYNVETNSVLAGNISSRSALGYLGKIKDPETNSYVTCNYMTQLRSMGTAYQFPTIDNIFVDINEPGYNPSLSKAENVVADSCFLYIAFRSYYGDSLALMNIIAHELDIPYEEADVDNIMANFDPKAKGMLRDANGIHEPLSYTIRNLNQSEAKNNQSGYTPLISFSLNKEYKAKDGKTYKNFGTYLMRKFYDPATRPYFDNQYLFMHNICPGFYIETTGGLGSMATILSVQVVVNFRGYENGQFGDMITSFAGTEEVLQKTTFIQDQSELNNLIAKGNEGSYTYLKTPASIFTEMTIPVDEIMYGHEDDTLSTARIYLPRLNNTVTTPYTLGTTSEILLVPTNKVSEFFKNRYVSDERTSFLASFDANYNGFTFDNLSDLVIKLYNDNKAWIDEENTYVMQRMLADGIAVQAYPLEQLQELRKPYLREFQAMNPTPFKVSIIPVETTYSIVGQTSILSKVTYDMSLSSTKLVKGTGNFDAYGNKVTSPVTVSVIYSKFNNQ